MKNRNAFLQYFAEGEQPGTETQKHGYSYEQAEEIANARAERATKSALTSYFKQAGLTEEEATAAFEDYKKKKLENTPNIKAIEEERDAAKAELQKYKNTEVMKKAGVKDEYLEYVSYEIAKDTSDKKFDEKLAEFLKKHPTYAAEKKTYTVKTGTKQEDGKGGKEGNADINAILRARLKKK